MPSWGVIAAKDLSLLWRDRVALFWVVGFPIVFALFFGSVMKTGSESGTPPMTVVVIDETPSAEVPPVFDRQHLASFLEGAGVHVSRAPEATARDAVRRGEAVAFVRVSPGEEVPIVLGIDPSRRTEAALLQSLLIAAVAPPMPAGRAPVETVSVIHTRGGGRTSFEIVFPAMILWGLLGCAASFAIAMVAERASGTLLRLRAAPVTRTSILGGKTAACAVACLADALLLSAVGWLLLGIHIEHPWKYVVAVGGTVLCFSGLTMALSMLGRTEQAVAGAGWATLILMAMLGGAMVPLHLFPDWMLSLSDVSPVKWGILALEGATWREFRWSELWKPLSVLLSVGIVGFAAGVGLLVSYHEL